MSTIVADATGSMGPTTMSSVVIDVVGSMVGSMGAELAIFSCTLVVAALIRIFSGKLAAKRARTKVAGHEEPRAEKAACTRGARPASPFGGATRPQPREQRLRPSAQDPQHLFDEVCRAASQASRSPWEALALYQEMRSSPCELKVAEIAKGSKHSAPEFYNVLMQCAIRAGRPQLIEGIIDDMARHEVPRSRQFYESAMKLLAGKRQHQLALSVYDRMVADGVQPSAVTCSCLVSFASEVGDSDRAVGFFEQLCSLGTPSVRSAMTVLRVHAKRQDWENSLKTLRTLQGWNMPIDSLLLNVVLATGVASRKADAAEELLTEFASVKPRVVDVVSYNTLIKGFAVTGDSSRAVAAMERMRALGMKPNAITYNTAMDAAVRGGSAEEAWGVLAMMRRDGVPADKYTCSILVKGLQEKATAEQLDDCLSMLQGVDSRADAALRTSLFDIVLAAAAKLHNGTLLMRAFNQMREQGLAPKGNTYQLMIRSLSQQGASSHCGLLWRQMLSEGIRPRPEVFVAVVDTHLGAGEAAGAMEALEALRAGLVGDEQAHSLLSEGRTALVRALCRVGKVDEASQLYLEGHRGGCPAAWDAATRALLARAQAESGRTEEAWKTIVDMVGAGGRPNEATITAYLGACSEDAKPGAASKLLKMLQAAHSAPSWPEKNGKRKQAF